MIFNQLGPNYDPIFYDVMLYIVGGVIFLIIIILVIVVVVLTKSKKRNNKQHLDTLNDSIDDSSDKEKWDGI